MTDWVRLWHDMPTDPKWRVVARKSGQSIPLVIAVMNFVMVNASANANERGRTHNLNAEDIAAALDVDEAHVQAVLDAMQGKVMNGDQLTGWERRQPKREDSSAERAKEWRERKRTQTNAVELPESDTDTDTDKKDNPLPPSGGFERFWNLYPHKVGEASARRAFAKAELKVTIDVIIAGLARYIATKPPTVSWKNPAGWLNAERWADLPANPAAKPVIVSTGPKRTWAEQLEDREGEKRAAASSDLRPICLPTDVIRMQIEGTVS